MDKELYQKHNKLLICCDLSIDCIIFSSFPLSVSS